MPRVNGIMQPLPNIYGVPGRPVESAKYNSQIDDFVRDANDARPVTAGGTGANDAQGARDALGVTTEIAGLRGGVDAAYDTLKKLFDWANTTLAPRAWFTAPVTGNAGSFLRSNGAAWEARSPTSMRVDISAQVRTELTNALELGSELTGDRTAVIDMHAAGTPNQYDFSLRIARFAGVNGPVEVRNTGSGQLAIVSGGTIAFTGAGVFGISYNGAAIWHSGNDGAGSGLDADLLDGLDSTYFANIPARLGFTPTRQLGANTIGFFWDANATLPVIRVDATDVYLAKHDTLNTVANTAGEVSGNAVRNLRLVGYSSHNDGTIPDAGRVSVGNVNSTVFATRLLQFFTNNGGWQNAGTA